MRPTRRRVIAVVMASWGSDSVAQTVAEQTFPDVVGARVTARGNDTFDFDVTLSSTYDSRPLLGCIPRQSARRPRAR